jgi:transcriptional regulator with XRE-family HTH domain
MSNDHPLRKWRQEQPPTPEGDKMTLTKLAEAVGVVPSHLSQIETGEREPSLALASRLSKVTGIPIDKFVRPRENAA